MFPFAVESSAMLTITIASHYHFRLMTMHHFTTRTTFLLSRRISTGLDDRAQTRSRVGFGGDCGGSARFGSPDLISLITLTVSLVALILTLLQVAQ